MELALAPTLHYDVLDDLHILELTSIIKWKESFAVWQAFYSPRFTQELHVLELTPSGAPVKWRKSSVRITNVDVGAFLDQKLYDLMFLSIIRYA